MTDTVWSRLVARAEQRPDAVAILQKRFGKWSSTSIAELVSRSARTAAALRDVGIGESDVVAMVLGPFESRIVIDLALQLSGAVVVGISSNTPLATTEHILGDARPRVAIVQGQGGADALLGLMEAGSLTSIERMHYLDPAGVQDYANPVLAPFPTVAPDGPVPDSVAAMVADLDPGHGVVRSYTSGTTGLPTAVVRTHGNVLAAAEATIAAFGLGAEDRVLSIRALSDPVEHGATIFAALVSGAALVLPESRASVRQAMVEIAPTYLHLTQRFLEEIATDVRLQMQSARGLKRQVLRWWNRQLKADDAAGRVPQPSIASRLMVGRPVLAKLGLDRTRWVLVSGTAASTEAVRFFEALGLDVRPAYGSTEVGGLALASTTKAMGVHGVLTALPGVHARVKDGELQLSGPAVTVASAGSPPTEDGEWLRTGDRAEEVAEGLSVTGRVADTISLGGGRTLTAQLLASRLRASPYIRDAVVMQEGDRIIAVLEPAASPLGRWATARGLRYTTMRSLVSLPEVGQLLERACEVGAGRLDTRVDEVRILAEPLSAAAGTLTTTETVIPHAVLEAPVIDRSATQARPAGAAATSGTPAA